MSIWDYFRRGGIVFLWRIKQCPPPPLECQSDVPPLRLQCSSLSLTAALATISLVKDWPISLFVVSQRQITSVAPSVCRKSPCETLRLGNVYKHSLRATGNFQRKTSPPPPSLSLQPTLPLLAAAPHRQWIWDQGAWERSEVSERKAQMTLRWISTKWSSLSRTITTPRHHDQQV